MHIPPKIPGLRIVTIMVALYGVVWIALEGNLGRVLLLAAGLSLVVVGHVVQRTLGGRLLSRRRWLVLSAGIGCILALSVGLLALLLMALKTGLHAHGPEFAREEFDWLLGQLPVWAVAGALAGLGFGLLRVTVVGGEPPHGDTDS